MNNSNEKENERIIKVLDEIINEILDELFPKQNLGFTLLLFEFCNPGIANYISTAKRSDMIKHLRETANRLENKEDIPPTIGGIQ